MFLSDIGSGEVVQGRAKSIGERFLFLTSRSIFRRKELGEDKDAI